MPVILHLGLGAFHRAHQAVYLQRLIEAGDTSWRLVSGNICAGQETIESALIAQGGAYTLETVSPEGERRFELISAISRVLPFAPDLHELLSLGADPETRIVSFTVTEAGYEDGAVLYATLIAILRQRMQANAGPLTLLSCDNLRHNGQVVRKGLLKQLRAEGDMALLDSVETHTRCPSCMVDRITPRPPAGVTDRLMAEAFCQWVIEDDFANGRPAWERVGAELVDAVAPYEEAKIRILNASHSAIAWAGTLAGYRCIHEAVRDPAVRSLAEAYVTDDVIPCLLPSPLDLAAYRDTVLSRFGNAALGDTCQRVVADGFAKLPGFIVPTIRERLAKGASIASSAMLPALFLAFLQRWHAGALSQPCQDQAMDPAVAHAICAAADPVLAFSLNQQLWGDLAGDARVLSALREAMARLP
ncbi:MAG TPA: mannitol dehydrogenase family protein [Burkholderiaceae bacterium]|jgi:D-arabinitol 4-dehydrogenase